MVEKFEIKKETKNIPKNQLTKKELEFAKTNKKGIEITKQKKAQEKIIKNQTKLELKNLKNEIKWKEYNWLKNVDKTRWIEKISKEKLINFTAMVLAEAKAEWEKWMAAVWYSILNRTKLWWKDINQVLFEKGQYSPIMDGRFIKIRNKITPEDLNFAKKIIKWEIKNPIWKATFFQNKTSEKQKWNWQKTAKTLDQKNKIVIWNHIFRTEIAHA